MIKIKTNQMMNWLLVSVFLDHTSINIIFPVLTLVCFDSASALFTPDTSMTIRGLWYGLAVSVYHFGKVVSAPMLGVASDYLGRRLLLLVGAIGAMLMAGLISIGLLLGTVGLLVLGRLLGGLCAVKGVTQAAIGDFPSSKKLLYMGYLQAAIALGALLGPLLGGYAANHFFTPTLNFAMPFWLAAFIGFISLLLVYYKVPETLSKKAQPSWLSVLTSLKVTALKPEILKISLLLLLSQISWSFYYQYMPPFLKKGLAFNATEVGLFLAWVALWLVLAASLGVKLLKKYLQLKQIILFATVLTLAGILLTLSSTVLENSFWRQGLIWLAAVPVAVGDVIAYIAFTILYSDTAKGSEQGLVMGICLIVAQMVWFMTGLLGGVLVGIHILLPLLVAPLGVIVLLTLLSYKSNWLSIHKEESSVL